MPNRPEGEGTLIGQIPAWIAHIDDTEPALRGPIDITVIDTHVEISLGTCWATLNEDEHLELIIALHKAWVAARRAAKARAVFAALGIEWL